MGSYTGPFPDEHDCDRGLRIASNKLYGCMMT